MTATRGIIGISLVAATGILAMQSGGVRFNARDRDPSSSISSQSRILYADSVLRAPMAIQAIAITVTPTVTFDPNTGYYTYSYVIFSSPTSENDVDVFSLAPVPRPLSINSPLHWSAYRYQYQGMDSAIVWNVTDTGTLPPGYVDTGNVPPSEYDISPGGTQGGFSFTTPVPPMDNAVMFFAQGFDTLPGGETGDEDPQPTLFQAGVTGTVRGPGGAIGVEDRNGHEESGISGVMPNPTAGNAAISFFVGKSGTVSLGVFDVGGRMIRSLVKEKMASGSHVVRWDGRSASGRTVPPGVYFYRLWVDGRAVSERRVVVVP